MPDPTTPGLELNLRAQKADLPKLLALLAKWLPPAAAETVRDWVNTLHLTYEDTLETPEGPVGVKLDLQVVE